MSDKYLLSNLKTTLSTVSDTKLRDDIKPVSSSNAAKIVTYAVDAHEDNKLNACITDAVIHDASEDWATLCACILLVERSITNKVLTVFLSAEHALLDINKHLNVSPEVLESVLHRHDRYALYFSSELLRKCIIDVN